MTTRGGTRRDLFRALTERAEIIGDLRDDLASLCDKLRDVADDMDTSLAGSAQYVSRLYALANRFDWRNDASRVDSALAVDPSRSTPDMNADPTTEPAHVG